MTCIICSNNFGIQEEIMVGNYCNNFCLSKKIDWLHDCFTWKNVGNDFYIHGGVLANI